jgi:hypothetical protein
LFFGYVGTTQVGKAQVSPAQVRISQVSIPQVGITQVGIPQVRRFAQVTDTNYVTGCREQLLASVGSIHDRA